MKPISKNPPMVKATREFLDGLQLPEHKHGPNPNVERVALMNAMMLHCHGIKEGARTVTCDPAQEQLATTLHCSKSHIERLIKELKELGFLSKQNRGPNKSCLYTLYQTPQQLTGDETQQQLTGQGTLKTPQLDAEDPSTQERRPVNLEGKTRQLDAKTPQHVDVLRSISGAIPQERNTQALRAQGEPKQNNSVGFSSDAVASPDRQKPVNELGTADKNLPDIQTTKGVPDGFVWDGQLKKYVREVRQ